MAERFKLTNRYKGYVNKPEPTNLDPEYMIPGSQNVIVNLDGSIGSRKGVSLVPTAIAEVAEAITARIDWKTSRGDYFTLVRYGTKLDAIFKDEAGVLTTLRLSAALAVGDSEGSFTTVFDDIRIIDKMLLATGTDSLTSWSGAILKVSAVTSNTITVASGTWGIKGFATTGNVVIDGTTYAYTGGSDTDTLTGVTPDPAGSVGKYAFEPVVNESLTDVPTTYKIDFANVYQNQVYLGSRSSRLVLVSSRIDYTLYTLVADNNRAAGDPNEFLLDDNSAGFLPTKQSMLMFGSSNTVMEVKYVLSADQTKEAFTIQHVINGSNQGSLAPNARLSINGNIYYVNRDKQLGVIQVGSSLTQSLDDTNPSELVEKDFKSFNWTDSQMISWERNIVVVVPKANVLLLYQIDDALWQAPQIFANIDIGMVSIDDDNRLIGHSYTKNVSYVLFDETTNNDIDAEIDTIAIFAYNGYGERSRNKDFGMYYQDGYITSGGKLTRTLLFDFEGAGGSDIQSFKGTETNYLQSAGVSAGLGGAPLGERDLAGGSPQFVDTEKRFRYIDSLVARDFYELQVSYSQKELGASWRLVAHGPDVDLNSNNNNDILRE